jgi:hypothetical protein
MRHAGRASAILIAVVGAGSVAADLVIRSLPRLNESKLDEASNLLFLVLMLEYVAVGAYLAFRQPHHPIGWILAVPLLLMAADGVAGDYAEYAAVATPGGLPAGADVGDAARAFGGLWVGLIFAPTFGLLFFPDGKLASPRWRWVAWLAAASIVSEAVISTLQTLRPGSVPHALQSAASYILVATILMSASSIVVRFRRARGIERLQLKWIAMGAAVLALSLAAFPVMERVAPEFLDRMHLGNIVFPITWSAIPLSIAIAVLRYHLYDIDLLINRTLVYGATTAAIAATFWVGILALQAVLGPLTSGSELAVAASTLVSFTLFQPIRKRVQDAVDHRFDRSRYDAARTLERFADQLREEVDLDTLRADLIGAVRQTMSPAHASVWLREIER